MALMTMIGRTSDGLVLVGTMHQEDEQVSSGYKNAGRKLLIKIFTLDRQKCVRVSEPSKIIVQEANTPFSQEMHNRDWPLFIPVSKLALFQEMYYN